MKIYYTIFYDCIVYFFRNGSGSFKLGDIARKGNKRVNPKRILMTRRIEVKIEKILDEWNLDELCTGSFEVEKKKLLKKGYSGL
jgi:hypothetical protein